MNHRILLILAILCWGSIPVFAQFAGTILPDPESWEQGTRFEFMIETEVVADREGNPTTQSSARWVLEVDTITWNEYWFNWFAPEALQLHQFDPLIYSLLEGRVGNLPALPAAPPFRYTTTKRGAIKNLLNVERILRVYGPYYAYIGQRVEQEISDIELRESILGQVNLRLSPAGLREVFDQHIGPLHAWYGQTPPLEQSNIAVTTSSPMMDPLALPYATILTRDGENNRNLVISRIDDLYMERAPEMMLDWFFGPVRNREDKVGLMTVLENSDIDFTTVYTWKYDKKEHRITEYKLDKRNSWQLMHDLEPSKFEYRITIKAI